MLDTIPCTTFSVELPIGYDDGTSIHRGATIRKLRGTDEMLFYDEGLTGAELVTQLLLRCMVGLDGVPVIEPALVNQLYSADRNYLLYELRRITFGDDLRTTYTCPSCERALHLVENLSELTVRRLAAGERPADIVIQLVDGYVDQAKTVHRDVVLTLPRGTDEAFVSKQAETDLWQARDALLVRCIKKFGSLPRSALESYGIKIVRYLTLGDRRLLQEAINGAIPGVDFRRSIQCEHCAASFEAVMDVSDFFALS
jgi:hypothetical protein